MIASSNAKMLGLNDALGKWERDRPGRSVRRLAKQLGRQIPLTGWWLDAIAADGSGRDDRALHLQLHCSVAFVIARPRAPRKTIDTPGRNPPPEPTHWPNDSNRRRRVQWGQRTPGSP